MQSASQAVSRAALEGNYVLLRAGTLRLILPQSEVGMAEYLDAALEPADESGLLRHSANGTRCFAALSEQMTLMKNCPEDRFVVASLGDGDDDLGWCWSELRVLIGVELWPQPLPSVMLAPHTPVKYYVEHAGMLAYLCSARSLREFTFAQRV
jgi:hypothetical protein